MQRLCRVCQLWHELDEWPHACIEHFAPSVARSSLPSPMFMRDIEPYTSMITGERVSGRRQHRDHLKAHGCIEVGNEQPKPARTAPVLKTSRREALHRQLADMSDRQANKILAKAKKELNV